MNRLTSAVRIQLQTWRTTLSLPWAVLALSFAINLFIFAVDEDPEPQRATGGLTALYVFMFIAFAVTPKEYFPITLGLSGTRRGFYAATALLAIAQSLGYGVLVYALGAVESATRGWGLGMFFFDLPFLRGLNPVVHLLGYAVPLLLVAFVGLCVGSVFTRWGKVGMYALATAAVVVLGALSAIASATGLWSGVGRWFATDPLPALLIGWPLLLTAVLAGAAWLTLRRARS